MTRYLKMQKDLRLTLEEAQAVLVVLREVEGTTPDRPILRAVRKIRAATAQAANREKGFCNLKGRKGPETALAYSNRLREQARKNTIRLTGRESI